jgi:hypothetical protein
VASSSSQAIKAVIKNATENNNLNFFMRCEFGFKFTSKGEPGVLPQIHRGFIKLLRMRGRRK